MGESEGFISMKSWCFDSQETVDGDGNVVYDRAYGSPEIRYAIENLVGNGVYADPATNMQVTAAEGLTIKVNPGRCWIKGALGTVEPGGEIINLDADSTGGNYLIVARFDLSLADRDIHLTALKESSVGLTRNDSIYDLQLARVNIRAGATSISQSDITDTRYNSNICGIVTGILNQIDATNLFAQYGTFFAEFMAQLEETLTGDVAGNLLTLIDNHKKDFNNPHNVTKGQVGLGNVPNVEPYHPGNKPSKSDVGLGNVPNVEPYHPGNKPSKSDVGLGNVPNVEPYSASNPSFVIAEQDFNVIDFEKKPRVIFVDCASWAEDTSFVSSRLLYVVGHNVLVYKKESSYTKITWESNTRLKVEQVGDAPGVTAIGLY